MTLSRGERGENIKAALLMMFELLADEPINLSLFHPDQPPFSGRILRTTWEDLKRDGYVEESVPFLFRLTPNGWLYCLELTGASKSQEVMGRLGALFAAMKKRVKGRNGRAIFSYRELANELNEPHGWVFNVIDSRATSSLNSGRVGATWFNNERGQLVEVPVNFSMEPIDIAASLTVEHLQRIETLKVRLQNVEEDRNQFHCPHCDARMVGGGERDYPEYHCIVTYEIYACGMVTEDGNEHVPCPYGPRWPKPEEFDFKSEFHGTFWTCYGLPKTERARTINMIQEFGETREEAESKARDAVLPKKKNTPSQ